MSSAPAGTTKKKGPDIHVLRCLNPDCGEMLPFEVDSALVLHMDLAWMAREVDGVRFFPCRRCGGRNVVEEHRDAKGALRHRVTRFEPDPSRSAASVPRHPR
jgi:hypothetical protein